MTMVTSRRGAGSGSIVKRGENHWRVQYDDGRDPVTGERRRRRFSVSGTKKDAEEALRKALTQRDHGIDVSPERITLGEYLDQWLRDYGAPKLAPSTLRRYSGIARRLKETLGSV